MSFSIQWTDFPELYDNSQEIDRCYFSPSLPEKTNLKSHLFIQGDNYPVLKKLIPEYKNKIDLIYIDPPYNTGNAFTYNDKFGKTSDSHSQWLSFMNRRLSLAKELLCPTGCIFIAIDQAELYVLKLLCDQIFGEENFVNDFMWLHGKGKKDTWSRTLQQHTLCYGKNKKNLKPFVEIEFSDWAKKNADNDSRGNWFSGSISFSEKRSNPGHRNYYSVTSPSGAVWTRQWQVSKEEMNKLLMENKIYFGKAPEFNSVPRVKIFNEEAKEVIPKNIIDCVESTRKAQRHLDELLDLAQSDEKGIFDNPKPVNLISHLIEITNMKKDALVLDFFAGSGTTFESVVELNKKDNGTRRCILVQKPEEIKNKNSSRFATIFDLCQARVQKICEMTGVTIISSEVKFS